VVNDPAEAVRSPELAVMSAMAHGGEPDSEKVLQALVGALGSIDDQHATLHYDLVLAALPRAARGHLEDLMRIAYEYQSDFARKYVAEGRTEGRVEGRAEGAATALLTVLAARGVDVPDEVRARITGCTDLDQLEAWLRRAVTAHSIHDVIA
jgi:hypothetical protein